jgi:nucleoside-diphosphate-sugar epimerase
VTGGFGFLGSHVVEMLLGQADSEVHVVDNLSSNPIPPQKLLAELESPDRLTYDVMSIAEYMRDRPGQFDSIIHLASVVGPAGVLEHGGRIVASVVDDTYLLADYCIEHGCRLLDVSTSEVYGGGRDGLCDERDHKIVPAETSFRSEYAVAKLAAETALINLNRRTGLDVLIVRPFNIAGPRQSGEGGFVLPRFIAQAHLQLPLTIFGRGSARRAFTHVEDIADGILRTLREGEAGGIFNLGNPANQITVEELADTVLEVTGSISEKRFVDPQALYGPLFAEANDKFPEAGRAMTDLGWKPRHDVRRIVRDTWEYMVSTDPATFSRLAGGKVIEQLLDSQRSPSEQASAERVAT